MHFTLEFWAFLTKALRKRIQTIKGTIDWDIGKEDIKQIRVQLRKAAEAGEKQHITRELFILNALPATHYTRGIVNRRFIAGGSPCSIRCAYASLAASLSFPLPFPCHVYVKKFCAKAPRCFPP